MGTMQTRRERIARRITKQCILAAINSGNGAIDKAAALDEAVAAVEELAVSWSVGDRRSIDLSAYGYPDGWVMTIETRERGGDVAIVFKTWQMDRENMNSGTEAGRIKRGGRADMIRKSEDPAAATAREKAKWVLDVVR